MRKEIIILLILFGMILSINLVMALSLYSGENATFSIDTKESLYWDVTGNQSDMQGFYVYQEIYDNYSNITISADIKFISDSFTLILFENKTNEIIKEIYIYSSGSSGISIVYKNITQNNTIYKTIKIQIPTNCTNQTIESQPIEPEKQNFIIRFFKWIWELIKEIFKK